MPSSASDEQQPVMWIGERAVYAAYFVVAVYLVSMVVTALLLTFNVAAPFTWLPFDSTAVMRGEVWRALTYGLLNPPDVWLVVNLFFLGWFGRDVEKFFGRRLFLLLFGSMYLLCPVAFTLVGLFTPIFFTGAVGSLAMFVAFATLYPSVTIWLHISAKWAAITLVAVYTLMHLAYHSPGGLIALWTTTSFAFAFVRYQQGRWTLPRMKFRRRRASSAQVRETTTGELDALLDKIAKSGFGSLTPAERKTLEGYSSTLAKRKRRTPN